MDTANKQTNEHNVVFVVFVVLLAYICKRWFIRQNTDTHNTLQQNEEAVFRNAQGKTKAKKKHRKKAKNIMKDSKSNDVAKDVGATRPMTGENVESGGVQETEGMSSRGDSDWQSWVNKKTKTVIIA